MVPRIVPDPRRQRLTLEKLHHEEVDFVALARRSVGDAKAADVVQRANVWMGQLGNSARLAVEPLAKLRLGGERRREDLDGDGAIQPRVAGAIHLAHAALAKLRDDFVRTDARTRLERQSGEL